MPPVKRMPLQIAVAFDQLCNALLGGWADETLSSRAWRLRHSGRGRATFRRVIDALFFWQDGHCEAAYASELERAHQPSAFAGVPGGAADSPLPPLGEL
ncbi:MAG: hypothetical protein LIP28_04555 [Deltaproteobacteria bacterium]|nr:hypothetical protein [Deltaproteobacteria bacterium]